MAKITWDGVGQRFYETGVDRGVLYKPVNGVYSTGVPWNGLTTVTESPSGAESNPQYADNIKYLNLLSAEEFGATIEALTYPAEFAEHDGVILTNGVSVGQQTRKPFGLSYRTRLGNDVSGIDYGYKVHLVYGALASPSEKAYATINDSPEPATFSWELTTTAVEVGTVGGTTYKPTALLTVDSTKVSAANLAALEDILYGTAGTDPRLPLPAEVLALFAGTVTRVETVPPTYNATTDMITIPAVTGVIYSIGGEDQAPGSDYGPITEDTVVNARPAPGYAFTDASDDDFTINFS